MYTPKVSHNISVMAAPIDIGVSRRKFLKVEKEILELYKHLQDSLANDSISNQIKEWVSCFKSALSYKDESRIDSQLREFIKFLHEILVDPIRGPLDENSMLCSDGHTYSSMTYNLFMKTPQAFHHRSPKNPDNPQAHSFAPHPHVKLICQWLRKYNALPRSEELRKEYDSLIARSSFLPAKVQANPPPVALRVNSRRNEMLEYLERVEKKEKEQKKPPSKFSQELQNIQNSFLNSVSAIANQMNAQTRQLIQQQSEFQKEVTEKTAQIREAIQRAKTDLEELKKDLTALNSNLNDVKDKTKSIKQQDDELRKKIDETSQAIKEKEKEIDERNRILITVAVIGACAFAGWALAGCLANSGFAAALIPSSGLDGGMFMIGAIL